MIPRLSKIPDNDESITSHSNLSSDRLVMMRQLIRNYKTKIKNKEVQVLQIYFVATVIIQVIKTTFVQYSEKLNFQGN